MLFGCDPIYLSVGLLDTSVVLDQDYFTHSLLDQLGADVIFSFYLLPQLPFLLGGLTAVLSGSIEMKMASLQLEQLQIEVRLNRKRH